MALNLQFLDHSRIDDQYFLKKDLLVHSILNPVLTMNDKGNPLTVFAARTTNDLLQHYDKDTLKKADALYSKMVAAGQVLLVQLVRDQDIDLIRKDYFPDAVFTVFKDELLNLGAMAMLCFTAIDPKTYVQENLN